MNYSSLLRVDLVSLVVRQFDNIKYIHLFAKNDPAFLGMTPWWWTMAHPKKAGSVQLRCRVLSGSDWWKTKSGRASKVSVQSVRISSMAPFSNRLESDRERELNFFAKKWTFAPISKVEALYQVWVEKFPTKTWWEKGPSSSKPLKKQLAVSLAPYETDGRQRMPLHRLSRSLTSMEMGGSVKMSWNAWWWCWIHRSILGNWSWSLLELILARCETKGGSLGKAFRKTNERERRRWLRRSVLCWTRKSAFHSDSSVTKHTVIKIRCDFSPGIFTCREKMRKVFGNHNQFPGRPADFCSKNPLQLSKNCRMERLAWRRDIWQWTHCW